MCIRDRIYAVVADYSSGADTLSSLTDAMAANGGKVIGSVAVPLNTTDFSSYLLRAKDCLLYTSVWAARRRRLALPLSRLAL